MGRGRARWRAGRRPRRRRSRRRGGGGHPRSRRRAPSAAGLTGAASRSQACRAFDERFGPRTEQLEHLGAVQGSSGRGRARAPVACRTSGRTTRSTPGSGRGRRAPRRRRSPCSTRRRSRGVTARRLRSTPWPRRAAPSPRRCRRGRSACGPRRCGPRVTRSRWAKRAPILPACTKWAWAPGDVAGLEDPQHAEPVFEVALLDAVDVRLVEQPGGAIDPASAPAEVAFEPEALGELSPEVRRPVHARRRPSRPGGLAPSGRSPPRRGR